MFLRKWLAWVALLPIAAACVEEGPESQGAFSLEQAIYYGTPDTSAAHQAVVALYEGGRFQCSGTLIAQDYVLTAAHCLESNTTIEVRFGNSPGTFTHTRQSAQKIRHPQYNRWDVKNDIGLIRLATPAPDHIQPIRALPQSLAIGPEHEGNLNMEFVGFGDTETGSSEVKLKVTLPLLRQCSSAAGCNVSGNPWSVNPLPAGSLLYAQNTGGPCSGDSGGPAFVVFNGIEYVAGVTSYGDWWCTQYGVSTKVDYFWSFLGNYIVDVEDCTNGIDDTGNGLVDCQDPSCAQHAACLVTACTEAQPLRCGDVIHGDTTQGVTVWRDNACVSANRNPGPEQAWSVDVVQGIIVEAHLEMPETGNLDLYLLEGTCAAQSCSEHSTKGQGVTEYLRFTRASQPQWLMVDTHAGSTSYTLRLTCVELCDNGRDDNGNGLIDCQDPQCADVLHCRPEICDNGRDDNGNGLIDCADPACAAALHCQPELCDNGQDDNGNGLVDCLDPTCFDYPTCWIHGEICDNERDDNGNGLVDCADPDCHGSPACAEGPVDPVDPTDPSDPQPPTSPSDIADGHHLAGGQSCAVQPQHRSPAAPLWLLALAFGLAGGWQRRRIHR